MSLFKFRLLTAGLTSFGLAAAAPVVARAQPPAANVDVLARGPVHEAFAATVEHQVASAAVVAKAPPDPIEELPPDQKPAGDTVTWIPGYWHYDEERADFIWISGFWRVPPPGRVWMAGTWREVQGGWQWVHGFWQGVARAATVEYLPQPPAQVEFAPSIPAPADDHVYVPGSWVWRERYVWRPGTWVAHRPGWLWTPCHYRYTPAGYVYIDGYWDYPLGDRGVLFAPVYMRPAVYAQPAFVYTPSYAIAEPALYTSLFVRRGWGCYYFGDYFEAGYINRGYSAWCGSFRGSGFAVTVGFGGGYRHDPLWDYYRVQHRNDRAWSGRINDVYAGRFNGSVTRPPHTLVQQTTVVNNITNVTNNTTVVNNVNNTVNNVTMVAPLTTINRTNSNVTMRSVGRDERVAEQAIARDLRTVAVARKQQETVIADRAVRNPPTPGAAPVQPKSITLDVPKAYTARAQAPVAATAKAPPPAPVVVNRPAIVKTITPGEKPKLNPAPVATTPATITPGEKPKLNPAPVKPAIPPPVKAEPVKPTVPAPKPVVPVPAPKPMTVPPPPPKVEVPKPLPLPMPAPKPPMAAPIMPQPPKLVPPPAPMPPKAAPVVPPQPKPVIVPPPPAPRPPMAVPVPPPQPKPIVVPPPAPIPPKVVPFVPPPAPRPPMIVPMNNPAPKPAVVPPPAPAAPKPAPPKGGRDPKKP